jgi:hypothetical protein
MVDKLKLKSGQSNSGTQVIARDDDNTTAEYIGIATDY